MTAPGWDAVTGLLCWRGRVLKRVRADAVNERCLLDAFERQGWPEWIDNPLSRKDGVNRKRRLRETVKALNCGLDPPAIRFRTDWNGHVGWQTVT
jgi:hypothetical protein